MYISLLPRGLYICTYIHAIDYYSPLQGLPRSSVGKGSHYNAKNPPGFNSWIGKILWKRKWQPASGFLPGESHGQRSLKGPMGSQESENDLTTKPPHHSAIQKEWNNAICNNMDATRDFLTKWSKSDRERQKSYDIAYVGNRTEKSDVNELVYNTETDSQT